MKTVPKGFRMLIATSLVHPRSRLAKLQPVPLPRKDQLVVLHLHLQARVARRSPQAKVVHQVHQTKVAAHLRLQKKVLQQALQTKMADRRNHQMEAAVHHNLRLEVAIHRRVQQEEHLNHQAMEVPHQLRVMNCSHLQVQKMKLS